MRDNQEERNRLLWGAPVNVKKWETWESYTKRIQHGIPYSEAVDGYGVKGPSDGYGNKKR